MQDEATAQAIVDPLSEQYSGGVMQLKPIKQPTSLCTVRERLQIALERRRTLIDDCVAVRNQVRPLLLEIPLRAIKIVDAIFNLVTPSIARLKEENNAACYVLIYIHLAIVVHILFFTSFTIDKKRFLKMSIRNVATLMQSLQQIVCDRFGLFVQQQQHDLTVLAYPYTALFSAIGIRNLLKGASASHLVWWPKSLQSNSALTDEPAFGALIRRCDTAATTTAGTTTVLDHRQYDGVPLEVAILAGLVIHAPSWSMLIYEARLGCSLVTLVVGFQQRFRNLIDDSEKKRTIASTTLAELALESPLPLLPQPQHIPKRRRVIRTTLRLLPY